MLTGKSEENSPNEGAGLSIFYEMSQLMKCDLDFESIAICCRLIETGVNPKCLADCIKDIRKRGHEESNH